MITKIAKRLLPLVAALPGWYGVASAQVYSANAVGLWQFDFPEQTDLTGQTESDGTIWNSAGPAGPAIKVQAGNLLVWGLEPAMGNHAELAAVDGPAARIALESNINSGSLYYSLAFKVSDVGGLDSVGGTLAGFNDATGDSPDLPAPLAAQLMVRAGPGGYQIGLAKNSKKAADAVWSPQTFGSNQIVFVVARFHWGDANNGEASMWINPEPTDLDLDASPPPTLTSTVGDDMSEVQSFVLMQSPSPSQPNLTEVDEIRVGTSWAAVTPMRADYGDAPDHYRTLRAHKGPRHRLTGPILGNLRDRDPDGMPSAYAIGDDAFDGSDDEDGVTFPASLTPGTTGSVQVTTASGGTVDAWIDFDQNGHFDHPAERIAASLYLPPGTSSINFLVPSGIPGGGTYSRFRISEAGGLAPWGPAPDGEVEDYGPNKVIVSNDNPNGSDLSVEILSAADEVTDSDSVNYSISVSNSGPDAANAVEIVAAHGDALLSSLTANSAQAACQVEGSEVHCSVASLAPGQTVVIDVTAVPESDADVNIAASVDSDSADLIPADNVAFRTIRLRMKDWGDAPVGYPVTPAENGAYHSWGYNWKLGSRRDGENGGTHSACIYDDTHGTSDDEDGVLITGATGTISVQVVAARDGFLDAWVDFHRDLDWDDAGEQVFTSEPLTAGTNNLSITVPGYATTGDFVSRWRFSATGGLSYDGYGGKGEVEDHMIHWQAEDGDSDFGDAPDSYHTVLASDGPYHTIVSGWVLGTYIDSEPDGQPSSDALLDDTTSTSGVDDEDGVRFLSKLVQGHTATIQVVAYPAGKLDAWIDFNNNHEFDYLSADQIFTNEPVGPGTNTLTFEVPSGSTVGDTYARFRFSSVGNLTPTNGAPDGEVEDYKVGISGSYTNDPPGSDYGDAPDVYGTFEASGGPFHAVSTGWSIGDAPDTEYDGYPTANADGDNITDSDDENGVVFLDPLIPGSSADVQVEVTVPSAETGYLNGWVDVAGNGNFSDPDDHVIPDVMVSGGTHTLTLSIPIPAGAIVGDTYARFRLTDTPGISYGGGTGHGEVEDYKVTIQDPGTAEQANLRMQFIDVPAEVGEDDLITYTVLVSNTGPATATSVRFVGDVPQGALLPVESLSCSKGSGTLQGDNVVCSLDALNAHESATIQVAFATDTLIGEDIETETQPAVQNWLLTAAETDSDPSDNVGSASTTVTVKRDMADAPNSFHTLLSTNGPRHRIRPGWRLGLLNDRDPDGMPSPNADGDDLGDFNDDEDGVTFLTPLVSGMTATVRVDVVAPVSSNAYVNAWMDLDHDNTFSATNEHVIVDALVTPGTNDLSFTVPASALPGATYARFRLSAVMGLSYDGWGRKGEVEDYYGTQAGGEDLIILALDYGDAPERYHTTSASNGPRHVVRNQLYLGLFADEENDGIPTADAKGDDNDKPYGVNDEDGVSTLPVLEPGLSGTFQVMCTTTSGIPAHLDGWVDYNGNGQFDHPGEQISPGMMVTNGLNTIAYSVPADAVVGDTYLRLRISSAGGLTPEGFASDGEVEDYALRIDPASAAPTLTSAYADGQMVLTWDTNQAVLQEADSVTGPWTTVSNATSPLTITPNEPQKFFRLRSGN